MTTSQNLVEEWIFLKSSRRLSRPSSQYSTPTPSESSQHSTVTHKTGSCSRRLVGRFLSESLNIWRTVGTTIWHIVGTKGDIQRTSEGTGAPNSMLRWALCPSVVSADSGLPGIWRVAARQRWTVGFSHPLLIPSFLPSCTTSFPAWDSERSCLWSSCWIQLGQRLLQTLRQ